jgi:DNA-binding transcriptional LysR family regulator
MELPSVGMIKAFVAADLGVSLVSTCFARDDAQAGRVKLIELEDVELWRELGVVYRRDRTLPRATTTFIATIKELTSGRKAAAE